ncbi:MAG TPA: hypothetical protein VFM29_02330 [Vicinamibacteria bacterium]|nr:hypothetical protein [Vicinamibacteria bacterium]
MAEVLDNANKALAEIRGFLTETDVVHRKLEAAVGDVDEAVTEMTKAWTDAQVAGQALLAQVKADKDVADAEHAETMKAVADLKQALLDMKAKAEARFAAAEEDIRTFVTETQALRPLLTDSFDEVDEIAARLSDRARDIQQELEKNVGEAADLLTGEIKEDLDELQQDIEERGEKLSAFVQTEALPSVQKQLESFATTLGQFQQTIQEGLRDAGEKTEQAAGDAMQSYLTQQSETFTKIQEMVEELKTAFEKMKNTVEEGSKIGGTALDGVKTGVDTAATGLNLAIGTLNDTKQIFAKLGFS